MPKFTYRGKNLYGDITEGVYEGANEQAVAEMLKSRNYYVMEVKPLIERRDLLDFESYKKISTKELMLFCKQMSVILRAAIPMLHALAMVSNQTESKAMKNVIASLMNDIQRGASLTQAVQNQSSKLPSILIYMIEAGETSGTLDKSLDSLYKHFEKSYNTQKKVKSALTYPIIVIVVAVIVTVVLMVAVVPVFISMFSENSMDLPWVTKALIAVSRFITRYGLIVGVGFVGLLLAIKVYSTTSVGGLRVDRIKLKLPLFGQLNVKSAASVFSRTMATLLSAGVGIAESLEITSKVVTNRFVSDSLNNVRRQVIAGKGMYGPIREAGCFPPMLENMIMMGEEAGTIEAMLENAAGVYEEEVDSATQRITDMIQPMVIILLGLIVGFIVVGVAMPLFQMY